MTLTPLQGTDRLPLTCTRLGTCCHGHQIFISPWELARLARGLGLAPRAFREKYTDCGGTRLLFDGPPGTLGPPEHHKPSCALYRAEGGCSVHADRPLACRLYPLGRQRHEGAIRYFHPGSELPCIRLCPTVTELPAQSVAEYLAGQDPASGELAHDAYARLAYGMVQAAALISREGRLDRAPLAAFFQAGAALVPAERAARVPPGWLEQLTAPPLAELIDDPEAFVAAHGQRLADAIQRTFAAGSAADLTAAARTYLTLALHVGPTVGADIAVMGQVLEGTLGGGTSDQGP